MGKGGKPVDAHAPKRPLSGYFMFAGDMRPNLLKSNPDWGVADVAKEIGSQWSKLSDTKKKPYQDQAAKQKEAYDKKMEKYKKSANFTKHQEALKEWKKEQGNKPFKKDPNRPKRGLSAYLIFVNEKRPALDKEGVAFTDIAKRAAEMWAKLSEAQRAPYQKKASKSKADSEKAFEKYKKTKDYKNYMADKEAYETKQKASKAAAKAGAKPAAVAKK